MTLSVAENGFAADDVAQLLFTQIRKPSIATAAERCGRLCGRPTISTDQW